MQRTKTRMIWIALGLPALAAMGWLLYATRMQPMVQAAAPVAGEAQPAFIVAAGLVEPVTEEIKIGPEMDGKLREVRVEEGQPVRRGEVLAVLENNEFHARVRLAQAEMKGREAALLRLLNGARAEERREAQAGVREAEAVLENARGERERRAGLLERGAISRTEFESVDREYRVAQSRLEAARQRFGFVDASARADERLRAEAEVESARARLAEAQAMLEKTYVRAPVNGVVLHRYRKAGESVQASPGSPILSMGETNTLRVRVDVDETDVARLRIGQPAWVRAPAYGEQRFTGKVVRIGQMLGRKNIRTDEPTERVDLKILETLVELDPGQRLPIGLRVDAYIEAAGQS